MATEKTKNISLNAGTNLSPIQPVGRFLTSALECPRFFPMAKPVVETCRAEARVRAWGEALIVHRDAVVERLGIGRYRPWVAGCIQELPHEVVLLDRLGTGQIERAVQRL